jgi:secreted trypsin-like serine protease
MKNVTLLKYLLLLTPFMASATEVSTHIINGSNTSSDEYPSIASLVYEDSDGYLVYCGATLLDNYHVLTAAHCVYGDTDLTDSTYVVANLDNKKDYYDGMSGRAKAVNFYYPDDYRDSSALVWPNDVAIIEVEESLNISSSQFVERATYSEQLEYMDPDLSHSAVGHGLVDNSNGTVNQLQEASLSVVEDQEICDDAVGGVNLVDRICTTGPESSSTGLLNSTCSGDSGGPLYWQDGTQWVQIGITSFGPQVCGDPDPDLVFSSVFTEVAAHNEWIDDVLGNRVEPKIVVGSNPFDFGNYGSSGGVFGLGALLMGVVLFATRFKKKL